MNPLGHTCRPSEDPRQAGVCGCGRRLSEGEAQQPVPNQADNSRPRDVPRERLSTSLAAQHVGFSALKLQALAESRVLPGGVRKDRDLAQEVREELADARNYLTWLDQEQNNPDVTMHVVLALAGLVVAWQELDLACRASAYHR